MPGVAVLAVERALGIPVDDDCFDGSCGGLGIDLCVLGTFVQIPVGPCLDVGILDATLNLEAVTGNTLTPGSFSWYFGPPLHQLVTSESPHVLAEATC